jgi:hypothetical protein
VILLDRDDLGQEDDLAVHGGSPPARTAGRPRSPRPGPLAPARRALSPRGGAGSSRSPPLQNFGGSFFSVIGTASGKS